MTGFKPRTGDGNDISANLDTTTAYLLWSRYLSKMAKLKMLIKCNFFTFIVVLVTESLFFVSSINGKDQEWFASF